MGSALLKHMGANLTVELDKGGALRGQVVQPCSFRFQFLVARGHLFPRPFNRIHFFTIKRQGNGQVMLTMSRSLVLGDPGGRGIATGFFGIQMIGGGGAVGTRWRPFAFGCLFLGLQFVLGCQFHQARFGRFQFGTSLDATIIRIGHLFTQIAHQPNVLHASEVRGEFGQGFQRLIVFGNAGQQDGFGLGEIGMSFGGQELVTQGDEFSHFTFNEEKDVD